MAPENETGDEDSEDVTVKQMLIECNNVSVLPEISSEEMRFQQLQDPNLVDVIKHIECQTKLPFKEIKKRNSKVTRKLLLQYDKLEELEERSVM